MRGAVLTDRRLRRLSSQTGQPEHVWTALSTAAALYRDLAMTFWVAATDAALAAVRKR